MARQVKQNLILIYICVDLCHLWLIPIIKEPEKLRANPCFRGHPKRLVTKKTPLFRSA
jgi:hypothetical protein